VDLLSLEFGMLQIRGGDDDPAGGMHLHSHSVAPLRWMPEERLEHADDILKAMDIIVEQDHIVEWRSLCLLLCFLSGPRDGASHRLVFIPCS
jgi:hypothetical protein